MKVAITGSTGLVGGALARRLEGRGDEVVRIARGGAGAEGVDWAPGRGLGPRGRLSRAAMPSFT